MSILTAANVDAGGYVVYHRYASAGATAFESVGTVANDEDFRINVIKHMETFTASQLGDGPADGIYTGKTCTVSMVLNEINTQAALSLVYPESERNTSGTGAHGGIPGQMGAVGGLVSALGGGLRLAPYYDNLSSYGDPTNSDYEVINIPCLWVEDGHEIARMLRSGRHTIPLRLTVFPFIDTDDSDKLKLWNYVDTPTS